MRNHDFNEMTELVCSNFFQLNVNSCFVNVFLVPLFLQVFTAIRNMAHQHRELYLLLDDVEQLRRYAHSGISKHNALDDAVGKARAKSRHWEQKAKEGT